MNHVIFQIVMISILLSPALVNVENFEKGRYVDGRPQTCATRETQLWGGGGGRRMKCSFCILLYNETIKLNIKIVCNYTVVYYFIPIFKGIKRFTHVRHPVRVRLVAYSAVLPAASVRSTMSFLWPGQMDSGFMYTTGSPSSRALSIIYIYIEEIHTRR